MCGQNTKEMDTIHCVTPFRLFCKHPKFLFAIRSPNFHMRVTSYWMHNALMDILKATGNWYKDISEDLQGYTPSSILHYNDVIMGAIASQITSLTIVHSTIYSDADQRKHQNSASLAFFAVNSPGTGEFPAQMASYAENVSIWWRHHGFQTQYQYSYCSLLWKGQGSVFTFILRDVWREDIYRFCMAIRWDWGRHPNWKYRDAQIIQLHAFRIHSSNGYLNQAGKYFVTKLIKYCFLC